MPITTGRFLHSLELPLNTAQQYYPTVSLIVRSAEDQLLQCTLQA